MLFRYSLSWECVFRSPNERGPSCQERVTKHAEAKSVTRFTPTPPTLWKCGNTERERLPDVSVASFGSRIILEVVIGNDDRVKVRDEDILRNPFRQICALRIKAKSGALYVGTGWLIGPRAVATAGHCVYMLKEDGWAQSIEGIPDKFGDREPLGRFTSNRFRAVDGWTDKQNSDFDYGMILLDDDMPGQRLGWFEVASEPDAGLLHTQANISGYPADRDYANFQYFHARPLARVTETRLEYDIDTAGGQSGSPIWIDTEDGIIAVGIHTNGAATGNSGTRINEDVMKNLIAWRDGKSRRSKPLMILRTEPATNSRPLSGG